MNPGDIVFVHGSTRNLVDDAIMLGETLIDHTPLLQNYVHCAIYIGDGKVAEIQGSKLSGEGLLSAYEGRYDVGELNLTDEQRAAVVAKAAQLYGRPYDWGDIAKIGIEALTHIDLPHKDCEGEFICCEYVRDVIRDATGVVLSDKPLCNVEDLSLSPEIRIRKNLPN